MTDDQDTGDYVDPIGEQEETEESEETTTEPESTAITPRQQLLISAYSGGGIGLAVGYFMGMSISPLVGTVVGALATSLALILGISGESFTNDKAVRIGSFGLACVLAAVFGTYLRAHQHLGPSIEDQYRQYIAVGFSEEESREFIKFTELGIANPEWTVATQYVDPEYASEAPAASLAQLTKTAVLYSTEIESGTCSTLLEENDLETLEFQFEFQGGVWSSMLNRANENFSDDAVRREVLLAMRNGICDPDSEEAVEFENCDAVSHVNATLSPQDARNAFTSAGHPWSRIGEVVSALAPEHQSTVLAIMQEELCSES